MNARMRKTAQAIGGGIALLVLRAALPVLLTWLANRSLRKVPGYRGSVQRIRLDFTAPRVMVQGLSLAALNGGRPEHHLQVASIVAGSRWRDILAGKWVGYIRLDAPWVLVNLEGQQRNANGNSSKPAQEKKVVEQSSWQERVNQLPAFRLASAMLADGEIRVRGDPRPGWHGSELTA
jgi:hypothetical protein